MPLRQQLPLVCPGIFIRSSFMVTPALNPHAFILNTRSSFVVAELALYVIIWLLFYDIWKEFISSVIMPALII